jgi:hypothetical protein
LGRLFGVYAVKIRTFSDLVALAESIDINDPSAKNHFRDLFHVYNTALNNPPEGVIGVGAITYAEQKLAEFQRESN